MTNKTVYITITTTDVETLKSLCFYMRTINPNNINIFDNSTSNDLNILDKANYNIYKIPWNIEVIFYKQKYNNN